MSQSLVSNRVHIIFSTHNREALISTALQNQLWSYIVGIGKNHGIPVLGIGGMEDHVHLLVALPATITLSKVVQLIKANSSRWTNDQSKGFAWQKDMVLSESALQTLIRRWNTSRTKRCITGAEIFARNSWNF